MGDIALGKQIRKHLRSAPDATVQELAEAMKETEDDVTRVLDEYAPKGKADVEHCGPGQGGGWVEPPDAA